jgi:hypothetical protein
VRNSELVARARGLFLAGVITIGSASAAHAADVTVTPGNLDGWVVQTSGTTQSVTFENGPGNPPLPPGVLS